MQPPLEIWNKLRFWFNDDVRLSIASVSIPFGQRYITIDLKAQNFLAFEVPSLYLEKIVTTNSTISTLCDDGENVAATGSPASSVRTYTPLEVYHGVTDIAIEKLELYINNIFVNPEIHDIYIKRIGFSLIRVYRQQVQRCSQSDADEKLLSQIKWPVEYMFVGLRPSWNTSAANKNQWRDWHRLTHVVESTVNEPDVSQYSSVAKVVPDKYYLPVPTIDSITLTTHGVTIFDVFNDTFYNQYMPLHYGGAAITTPDDPNTLFLNMCLFPRAYQPSGHFNVSRARETYLRWTTSYVSSKTPADLIVVAVVINFLVLTDGSAVLRFTT